MPAEDLSPAKPSNPVVTAASISAKLYESAMDQHDNKGGQATKDLNAALQELQQMQKTMGGNSPAYTELLDLILRLDIRKLAFLGNRRDRKQDQH